jgi:hypothetical protein
MMILASFSAFLGSVWFAALTFCLGVAGGVFLVKRGIIK